MLGSCATSKLMGCDLSLGTFGLPGVPPSVNPESVQEFLKHDSSPCTSSSGVFSSFAIVATKSNGFWPKINSI